MTVLKNFRGLEKNILSNLRLKTNFPVKQIITPSYLMLKFGHF